jgi:type IV pilus assembly protein PilW
MKKPLAPSRGFTLLEVMIASALSLVVITGALTAGVYLQRRGLLEERTMEAQNAGRAARDLLVPALQRAGAGFGKARLNVGGNSGVLDQRYALWVTTNATFSSDSSFSPPSGVYAGLISDALEVWDADSSRAVQLAAAANPTACPSDVWNGTLLCGFDITRTAPPPGTLTVVVNPNASTACVGVVGAARSATTLAWTPGVPGRPLPSGSACTTAASINEVLGTGAGDDVLLMPLTARAFRVNWRSGAPVLEMDPDGAAGNLPYAPLAQDIERIKIRMGTYNPDQPGNDVVFFPDSTAGRPALDACTNATCWSRVPGDAGTMGPNNVGPGSARDELMRRVRLVELLITSRTARADREAVRLGANGSTLDEEGNPNDGFKRRHFIQRIAPRNFAISGG